VFIALLYNVARYRYRYLSVRYSVTRILVL
jgi:hypothetical protein